MAGERQHMNPAQVAGVDEAGRGPLAGPVVAAAVVLNPAAPVEGLADSKKLSDAKRRALVPLIKANATAYAIAEATVEEIDELNILKATLLAMQRAVEKLKLTPSLALVDGNRAPVLSCPVETVVKGDAKHPEIGAASILAKVYRDDLMLALHTRYPGFGFDVHKGYPTAAHRDRLAALGPCPAHRRSFGPVKAAVRPDRG